MLIYLFILYILYIFLNFYIFFNKGVQRTFDMIFF